MADRKMLSGAWAGKFAIDESGTWAFLEQTQPNRVSPPPPGGRDHGPAAGLNEWQRSPGGLRRLFGLIAPNLGVSEKTDPVVKGLRQDLGLRVERHSII